MKTTPFKPDIFFLKGLVLSLAAYVFLFIIFFTDLSKAFYIHLLFRYIYFPLYGWLIIVIYAFLWAFLFNESILSVLRRAVLLGISMHISILLYKLHVQLLQGSPISSIYLYYINFVTIAVFAMLVFGAVSIIRQIALRGYDHALFFMPLVFLFITLSFLYFKIGSSITIFGIGLGILITYAMSYRLEVIKAAKRLVSNDKFVICSLFLIGFLVRFAFSLQILKLTGGGNVFIDASDDGRSYDALAWIIAQNPAKAFSAGEVFPTFWEPGYILFLSAIYKVFGHNFHAATIFQSIVNGLLPASSYLIGRFLFSKKVGILSGVLIAIDQALIMYSVVLGTEALSAALLSLVVLFFILYLRDPSRRLFIYILGLILGLSFIVRSSFMLLPIFMFLAFLFIEGVTFRRKILDMIGIMLISLCVVLPVTFMNYLNTGDFHLIVRSSDRLQACWLSALPGGEDVSPSNVKFIAMGIEPFKKPYASLSIVLKDPIRFVRTGLEIWPKRLRNFFYWPNFGFSDPVMLVNSSKIANEFASTTEFYMLITYLLGLYFTLRAVCRNRLPIILIMVIACFICVHVFLYRVNTVRYRVVVIPYMLIILSVGAANLSKFVSKGLRVRS